MDMGNIIKNLRKDMGVNQEALAEQFNVSVQAVSKWECGLSCPDTALLPSIARYFGVSLDFLFTGEGRTNISTAPEREWPDDGDLRVVQFIGHKMVTQNSLDMGHRLLLAIPGNAADFSVHIHGNADIQGDIGCTAYANGDINCGDVGCSAQAGGDVNCGDVGCEARADGDVNCGDVGCNAQAGGDVNCSDIGCEAHAGGDINCNAHL